MKIDGKEHAVEFPHPEGIRGEAREFAMERRFAAWLVCWFPGYRAAGRVTHIEFTDRLQQSCFMDWTVPASTPLAPVSSPGLLPAYGLHAQG